MILPYTNLCLSLFLQKQSLLKMTAIHNKEECAICTEHFTSQRRKKVECAKCLRHACSICYKTYFNESINDPHCMFCKHPWDMDFMNKMFTHRYMRTEWKDSRANILFAREQSYLPQAMEVVKRQIEVEALEKEKDDIYYQIQQLEHQMNQLNRRIRDIKNVSSSERTHDSSFSNRACITDGCKGILEKRTGHCILCNHTTCLRCNVTRANDDHECSQTDLDTWKIIQQGSKPCPNCSTIIFKAGGCDQMWCIQCHVAFSWKTGIVDNRRIHNPHYFEYLRANPHLENRDPQEEYDECEQIWHLRSYPRHVRNNNRFSRMFEFLSHQVNYVLPNYRDKMIRGDHLDLRVPHLRNRITESGFKDMLVQRERTEYKTQRLIDIFQTVEIISRNLLNDVRGAQDTDIFELEFYKLIEFTNQQIQGINRTFKCKIKLLELPPVIYH